jgi:putative transposase
MTQPQFRAGQYYHVYNRGVNRQPIFLAKENWGFFIQRLREYFLPEYADIIAYCLMPTHYHLSVHLHHDDFGMQVMQPFGTSYTKAINKQHDRVGPLFQGRFRAVLVKDDAYLTNLTKYIHLNPVKAGLVKEPTAWPYSSYSDYIGLRDGTLPKPMIILNRFPSRQAYRTYVEEEPTQRNSAFDRWLRGYLDADL